MIVTATTPPAVKAPFGTSDNTAERIARAVATNAALSAPQVPEQPKATESIAQSAASPEVLKQNPLSEDTKASEPEAVTASEAPKDALSSQYAILARRERAIRANTQKLNAEREAFKAERAALEARLAALESDISSKYVSKDKLTQDPFNTLSEHGVSYETITNQILNQPSAEEQRMRRIEMQAEERFKKLQDEQDNIKKSLEQKEQQDYQAAISQIRSEAKRLIQNDPAFETIKETKSTEDVVRLITEVFEKDGELMSVDEAAALVEEELVSSILNTVKINKIQQKLKPAQAAPKAAEPAKASQQPGSMRTLTNASSSTKPLSRLERAILAGRGDL